MTPGRFEALVVELCERRPRLWISLLAAAVYLPWLGAEPVYTTLEGLRLVPAREMLQTGDWIVPRLGGDPYLAKPPLVYWAIGLLSAPFGEVTPVLGRLVSVLCMWGTMLLVLSFGRRHLSGRAAFLAAAATGLAALSFEKGSRAELEALLLLTSTWGLLSLYEACLAEPRRTAWIAFAALGLGCAVLTKGPVPLVAFGCASAAVLAAAPRPRSAALLLATLAGAVLVCLPWVVGLTLQFESEELRRVLDVELFGRVEEADAINEEGPLYYPVALVRGMAPFSLLLPALLALRGAAPRSLLGFLLAWSLGTLVAISLSSGKETRYLLPTYPAFGLLIGWGWMRRAELPWLERYGRMLLRGALALAWALPVALAAAVLWRAVPETRAVSLALCAALAVGVAAFQLGGSQRPALGLGGSQRPARGLGGSHRLALVLGGLLLALVSLRGLWAEAYWPVRAPGYPYEAIGDGIDQHVGNEQTVLLLGRVSASLQFYVDRPMDRVGTRSLESCLAGQDCGGDFLLSDRAVEGQARELASWPAKRRTYRLYALGNGS
ncbi:MAG: glycosyltransferase family 39 protein [Myxococcota bacterium]|nr:glycosyltransferase family 39 protein [Myxococcota bacterium]